MIKTTDYPAWQIGLLVAVLIFLRASYRGRWRRFSNIENVPGPKPASWFGGNFLQMFNPAAWSYHEFLAKEYGSMVHLHGPFGSQALYTFDARAMHTIFVKDQETFDEADHFIKANQLLFGPGLLGTRGNDHRRQRKMLNPVFSAAHLRGMYPLFLEVTHRLEGAIVTKLESGPEIQEIDVLSWMARTALELIGQAGLGYSFDPLVGEESAHPYPRIIKQLIPTLLRLQFWITTIFPRVARIGTPKFRRFIVNLLPWKDLHHMRDMVDYMHEVASEIYEEKKKVFEGGDEAITQQTGRGKDLISILMKENMKAVDEDRLADSEVIGQVFRYPYFDATFLLIVPITLIFAAMDTTSNAMARILHLLVNRPDVQGKLRSELTQAREQNGGQDISYEDLGNLPYLDAICRETLRLYSPAPYVSRTASKDGVLPLHKPVLGLDGTQMHEIAVPKGTSILVSIFNANRNTDLWGKDADEWKPERWLSSLPSAVTDAPIPGDDVHWWWAILHVRVNILYSEFRSGAKGALLSGFKFSQLEMKTVISILVEKFEFLPSVQDAKTFWQMNSVTAPVVGENEHPQLPIRIRLAK
ncbi:hypothetical protein D9757_011368 [Collybiopsis confluens]|uniref:Cytochrome P450 n=1 Tax=Collybiopsis confluens TaxID=2823264 RepID=A0A8H5GAJ6_9AGAR|nr:hypothetical protein D9757_011368 [Collybiopsis confluens]